jgi:hypothetical protein
VLRAWQEEGLERETAGQQEQEGFLLLLSEKQINNTASSDKNGSLDFTDFKRGLEALRSLKSYE